MFLLWHPSLTAINLSYTFPILETSATALCGTTGTNTTNILHVLYCCYKATHSNNRESINHMTPTSSIFTCPGKGWNGLNMFSRILKYRRSTWQQLSGNLAVSGHALRRVCAANWDELTTVCLPGFWAGTPTTMEQKSVHVVMLLFQCECCECMNICIDSVV